MLHVVAESDVVITTAAVPGQKAPILITSAMVEHMQPGSVIVDLAAERGGNCEVTQPGETVTISGITVMGPLNVPSSLAHHASQLFAKNITTFLLNIVKDSTLNIDITDEIVAESMLTHSGEVVNKRFKELMQERGS
jgi:NAD(P) transhydrogenase subunit alpha